MNDTNLISAETVLKAPPAPGNVRAGLAGYAEWCGSPPVLTDAVDLIDQQAQRIAELEAVPDGWKLAPVDPTTKMIEAGRDVKRRRLLAVAMALREGRDPDPMTQAMAVEEEWSAMIAKAPEYKA